MNDDIKPYTTRSGAQQYKPSLRLLQELSDDMLGFCLACGDASTAAEPDCRKGTCDACGAPKVYGAEELALMGLCF